MLDEGKDSGDSGELLSPEPSGKTNQNEESDMVKKLEEYEVEKPEQLTIFELLGEDQEEYSHTVEIFDLVPKYMYRNPKSDNGRLEPIKRNPIIKVGGVDRMFEVVTTPARIEGKDGKWVDMFPTVRENVVDLCMRQMAFQGRGQYFDKAAGASFTLNELRKLLKKYNRAYDLADIREAIQVLRKSTLEIKCLDGDKVLNVSVNYLNESYVQSKREYKAEVNDSKCYVIFNSLVTKSINTKTLKPVNLDVLLKKYRGNVIAEHLHVRISRNMTQAKYNGRDNIFNITQKRLQSDTSMVVFDSYGENKRQVVNGLKKMIAAGYLDEFTMKDKKVGRRIVDTVYYLVVSEKFCREIVEANIAAKKIRGTDFNASIEAAKKRLEDQK
ncbi:MAG: hypothetical protein GY866_04835 [Proteobacteria bacterium]|nr:hypothetical protein [Pseudomonadota bacterium]